MSKNAVVGRAHSRPLRVLLLADGGKDHAATLLEHISSLVHLSYHEVRTLNPRGVESLRTLRLDEFDVVVIHYSLMILSDHYLSPWFRERIASYSGLKVQFIQDDYRHVEKMRRAMRELGIQLLFTLVPERAIEQVWPSAALPGVRKVTTLAGFVPNAAARFRTPPLASRPLDVGYRGRALPPWLGILGQEKSWIAEGFLARGTDHGLRCDLAWTENARIYGDDWFRFIASCRVTLGTESGSTITDFDGSVERQTRRYLVDNPDAGFWEVHREVLAPYEGNVRMNVISPRLFEAASLRTGLVLFPGEYSGVLERDRHYVALEKDFSNMDYVVATIKDGPALEKMIQRTRTEIVESGRFSYRSMVEGFDHLLNEMAQPGRARTGYRINLAEAEERVLRFSSRPKRALGTSARFSAGAWLVISDAAVCRVLVRYLTSRALQRAVRRDALWNDLVRLAIIRRANAGRLTAGADFVVEEEASAVGRVFVSRRLHPSDDRRDDGPGNVEHRSSPAGACNIIWRHGKVGDTFTVPLTPYRWVALPVVPRGGTPIYEFVTMRELRSHAPALLNQALAGLGTVERLERTAPAAAPRRLRLGFGLGFGPVRHTVHYARKARMAVGILRADIVLRTAFLQVLRSPRLRRDVSTRSFLADLVFLDLLRRANNGEMGGIARVEAEYVPGGALVFRSRGAGAGSPARLAECVRGTDVIGNIVWDNSEVGLIVQITQNGHRIPFGFLPDGERKFQALDTLLERDPTLVRRTIASCLIPLDLPPEADQESVNMKPASVEDGVAHARRRRSRQ